MNCRQLLEAIQTKLRAATWTGGANKVFHSGSVIISAWPDPEVALERRLVPMAIIRPGVATSDVEAGELPGLLQQEINVTIVVANANDPLGEAAMIGGAKSGGVTKSEGQGILDIELELFRAIKLMNANDSVNIVLQATGAVDVAMLDDVGYVAWRDYNFQALITDVTS